MILDKGSAGLGIWLFLNLSQSFPFPPFMCHRYLSDLRLPLLKTVSLVENMKELGTGAEMKTDFEEVLVQGQQIAIPKHCQACK